MKAEKRIANDTAAQNLIENIRESFGYHFENYIYDITEQIAIAMEGNSISKAQLAAKLHAGKSWVTQLLNGSNNFTLATMVKLSNALQTELRLTIRPQGWEQVAEFSKESYYPKELLWDKCELDGLIENKSSHSKEKSITLKKDSVADAYANEPSLSLAA